MNQPKWVAVGLVLLGLIFTGAGVVVTVGDNISPLNIPNPYAAQFFWGELAPLFALGILSIGGGFALWRFVKDNSSKPANILNNK